MRLTSAKWNGKLSLLIDLVTGRFDVLLSGAMQRYLIPGLGIVDVITDLHVVPGPNNQGSHVVGTAKAWVRRLDNSFFRVLTGGLPSLTTNLERGSDGIVHFTNLQVYSPKLRLSGAGVSASGTAPSTSTPAAGRRNTARCGWSSTARSTGRGSTSSSIGPTTRSAIDAMHLALDPTPAGYNYRANGGSRLGPFTSAGQILLPHNAPTVIADRRARCRRRARQRRSAGPIRGGFTGRLTLANGTLGGTLDFAPAGQAQRIDAHLTATNASFPDAFSVRSGRADGIDHPRRRQDHGRGQRRRARRCRRGAIALARLTANAKLVNGAGQVRAAFAGRRGAAFAFSTLADVSPDTIRLTGSGRIERQPLVLNQAAVLTRSGDGWALAPTSISFAGGNATVSGRSGSRARGPCPARRHAARGARPLLAQPGPRPARRPAALDYAWKGNRSGRARPQGPWAQPRRAGARLEADRRRRSPRSSTAIRPAMRAVAASDGAIVGRAQARFAPIGGGPAGRPS